MKDHFKNYFLYILIITALIWLYSASKSYYIQIGREQVESEYNDRTTLQEIEAQKQYKIRDELLIKAVKEKIENKEKYHKDIRGLKTEHLKYRERIRLEFQNINFKLSKLKTINRNLKMDLLETKALNLSLSTINKNILEDWTLSDNEIIKNLDMVVRKTVEDTEQKYIDFINKIDKIKRGKK